MIKEHSAGAVIFFRETGLTYYLILLYPYSSVNPLRDYWGFPKGGIEKGETLEETALREVAEETGLKNIKLINNFHQKEKYFFVRKKKKYFKRVDFFLAQTFNKKVEISYEHLDFKWLTFNDALEKLTFKNAKILLKKADKFIKNLKPLD